MFENFTSVLKKSADPSQSGRTISTRFYDTDLTDAAWAWVAPVLPAARPGGQPRTTNLRAVLNAIFYLPRNLPRNSAASARTGKRIVFDRKLEVMGRALYAGDHPIKDLTYGFLVRSTIAKGMIRAMDVSQAEKSQGVLAIYTPFNPLKLYAPLEYAEGAVSGAGCRRPAAALALWSWLQYSSPFRGGRRRH